MEVMESNNSVEKTPIWSLNSIQGQQLKLKWSAQQTNEKLNQIAQILYDLKLLFPCN